MPPPQDKETVCLRRAVPTLPPQASARRVCLNCVTLTAPITLTDEPHKVYDSECAGAMLTVLTIWKRWLHRGHMRAGTSPGYRRKKNAEPALCKKKKSGI